MRCLRWVLLPALLLGCTESQPAAPDISPEFAAAAVGWEEGESLYDETSYVWCLDEEIHWTGGFWYKYHFVVNGSREIWNYHYGPLAGLQGEGMTSGHVWLVDPSNLNGVTQHEVWIAPLGEPFQVINLTSPRWKFTNQTTGETLSWPFRAHLTRNAAGEVKVYNYVEPCRVK